MIVQVHGLTTDGVIFRFIQNNVDLRTMQWNGFNQDYRGSEFAGACYSPDGKWLFVTSIAGDHVRDHGTVG